MSFFDRDNLVGIRPSSAPITNIFDLWFVLRGAGFTTSCIMVSLAAAATATAASAVVSFVDGFLALGLPTVAVLMRLLGRL